MEPCTLEDPIYIDVDESKSNPGNGEESKSCPEPGSVAAEGWSVDEYRRGEYDTSAMDDTYV